MGAEARDRRAAQLRSARASDDGRAGGTERASSTVTGDFGRHERECAVVGRGIFGGIVRGT